MGEDGEGEGSMEGARSDLLQAPESTSAGYWMFAGAIGDSENGRDILGRSEGGQDRASQHLNSSLGGWDEAFDASVTNSDIL